jgi:hypothetical protein
LTTLAGLSIGRSQLTDLNAFCGLTVTTEHLAVYDNPLLVDISGSMRYGSHGVTKRDYACYLAASLAYLMHRQRDAVGLIAFDEAIVQRLPPSARASHLRAVLLGLERLPQGAKTNVAKPLGDLAKVLAKRGLVVVISDLLDDPAGVIQGLRHFRQRGTDVIVFHVLDPQELHFTFADVARFRDVESASEVFADPAAVRGEYLAAVGGFIDTYKQQLCGAGIDYHLLDTSKPLDLALVSYLKARGRVDVRPRFPRTAFLAGLLAVAVLIALHLFRRRTDRVIEFPAVQMRAAGAGRAAGAAAAAQSAAAGAARRRARALAVSFARPYVAGTTTQAGRGATIVAVDVSLSTSAPATALRARAATAIDDARPPIRGPRHLRRPRPGRDRADGRARRRGRRRRAHARGRRHELRGRRRHRGGRLRGGRPGGRRDRSAAAAGMAWKRSSVPTAWTSRAAVPAARQPPSRRFAATRRSSPSCRTTRRVRAPSRRAARRWTRAARAEVTLAPLAASDVRFTAALPPRGVADVSIDDPEGFRATTRGSGCSSRLVPHGARAHGRPAGIRLDRPLRPARSKPPPTPPMRVVVEDGRRYSAATTADRPDALVVIGTRTPRPSRPRASVDVSARRRTCAPVARPDIDVPTLAEALGVTVRVRPSR